MVKRFIIMWYCAAILAAHCFLVTFRARFGNASRSYITKSLHKGGVRLLKAVNTNCEVFVKDAYRLTNRNTPKIFMSNHLSLFDLPVITANVPEHIRVVIKKELTKVPFVGQAALASEQIIIDRGQITDSEKFYQVAREKLQSGISLWIFPEGTRSRSGELLPFKLGSMRLAIEIGAEIIPVAITGTNHILPVGKLMPFLNKKTSMHIGNPIDSKKFSTHSLKQLAELIRSEIQGMMPTLS